MTREQIYNQCVQKIDKTNTLLLQAATGTGKTKISIDLVNYLLDTNKTFPKKKKILILVAKKIHKQTWLDEITKWGGIGKNSQLTIECYESLKKHTSEYFDIVLADEVHHIGSEVRLELFSTIRYSFFIGLSATIPNKLCSYFKYKYHAQIVVCDLLEAIEDNILPEPQILLFPLIVDNRTKSETWEINAKQKGTIIYGDIKDIWKYKRAKQHAVLTCSQQQKLREFNNLIEFEKRKYIQTRSEILKQSWLYHAGKRLEWFTDIKIPVIKDILNHLKNQRTITFCKTITQAETVGKWCIHSKNSNASQLYEDFNKKKINHITAVNILNENANLTDCKYAIFSNLSSSEVVIPQRLGRSMRHHSPVIIVPYYKDTREQEIVEKMFAGYNEKYIKTIHSIQEIQ